MEIKHKTNNKGFTLVESITSVFIFAIIVSLLAGIFVFFLNAQRRALNTQVVIENTNYIMETLAKEIRMADSIVEPSSNQPCFTPTLANLLQITQKKNSLAYGVGAGLDSYIGYYFDPASRSVRRTVSKNSGGLADVDTILNTGNVEFVNFQFCIAGINIGDQVQPRVTILATVRSSSDPRYVFNIQTTVSSRNGM